MAVFGLHPRGNRVAVHQPRDARRWIRRSANTTAVNNDPNEVISYLAFNSLKPRGMDQSRLKDFSSKKNQFKVL